jgi:hypothetical protein
MRDSCVSPAPSGRHLRVVVASDTDPRVVEAFKDISSACEAFRLELIGAAERDRLICKAEARLGELGLEAVEEPPPQPKRRRRCRKRVQCLDVANMEHLAGVVAHWIEVSLIDETPDGRVVMNAERARELAWAARSISYSINISRREGSR